jgi:hypothetical protein
MNSRFIAGALPPDPRDFRSHDSGTSRDGDARKPCVRVGRRVCPGEDNRHSESVPTADATEIASHSSICGSCEMASTVCSVGKNYSPWDIHLQKVALPGHFSKDAIVCRAQSPKPGNLSAKRNDRSAWPRTLETLLCYTDESSSAAATRQTPRSTLRPAYRLAGCFPASTASFSAGKYQITTNRDATQTRRDRPTRLFVQHRHRDLP